MKYPFAITIDVEGDYWDNECASGIVEGVPLILEFLNRLNARGTFFWTAMAAVKHADILESVVEHGHEIACHSLNHENMAVLTEQQQSKVVGECDRLFSYLGITCRGFRAPRLCVNETLFPVLRENGYIYDSSLPFWGVRRYKYRQRYDDMELHELKVVPSYCFRLNRKLFLNVLERSHNTLGYCVFFFHPWEVVMSSEHVQQLPISKKLNFINWIGTGKGFLLDLENLLLENSKRLDFITCSEIIEVG